MRAVAVAAVGLPVRGICCRSWLPSSFSWAERTGKTYSYKACIFSSLDRSVHGHHSPGGVGDFVSFKKYEDTCLKHDSLGERICKDVNGALQDDLSRDKRAFFKSVTTSKKLFKATTNSERERLAKGRRHLSEQYNVKQFDVTDGLKDNQQAYLTSGEFDSTQGSGQFSDEGDTFLEVTSSSERDKTESAIKTKAFKALAARPLTAVQLRKKLIGNHFPSDMVEAVITELQASGIQSDYEYAETYSRSRWLYSSWGPKRIKSALMQRGVSRANTERALQYIFNDSDETDEEQRWGMSDSARRHLMAQATKKWLQGGNASSETRKRRMVSWLQYRGFEWDVITSVLKELQSNHSAQSSEKIL